METADLKDSVTVVVIMDIIWVAIVETIMGAFMAVDQDFSFK